MKINNFSNVSISSFLKERQNRFKPDDANKMNLNRLEKIDFLGKIHILENKKTKTGMILVKKGDLVISGINIEKGAVAVYTGEEDVLATIHYSSYSFDRSKIDVEYFRWFLRSKVFKDIVNSSIKGGIKTELKPKKFLSLVLPLPDLDTQIYIRKKLDSVVKEIVELNDTNCENYELVQKLRQAILQEAVSGKLVPQDPNDEPASELLQRIKAEKEKLIKGKKIKKEKPLQPDAENEILFQQPKGWKWVHLQEIMQINPRNYLSDEIDISFIPMNLIEDGFTDKHKSIKKKWGEVKYGFTHLMENDVVIAKITPCFQNRKSAIMRNLVNGYGAGTTELYVFRSYGNTIIPEFLLLLFKSKGFINGGIDSFKGTAGQQRVKREYIENLLVGLPPYNEQIRIASQSAQLMKLCDDLEEKTKENQKNSKLLMEAVLREAFEPK